MPLYGNVYNLKLYIYVKVLSVNLLYIYNLGYRNYAKCMKQTQNAKSLLHIRVNQCFSICPFCSFQSRTELTFECNYVI